MSLEEKVADGIKKAMLSRDEKTLRSLRAIKSAILNEKTSPGFNGSISNADEIKLLQKLVKQRKDSLEIYEAQNREDLASKEKEEIEVIETFLPSQLTEAELHPIIAKIIADNAASSMADMGKVMGIANRELAGKADGKTISAVVRSLLAQK